MVVFSIIGVLAFFSLSDLLPLQDHAMETDLSAIDSLPGGSFGAAVLDLSAGETLVSIGIGLYPLDGAEMFLLAYAADVSCGMGSQMEVTGADVVLASRILSEFNQDINTREFSLSQEESQLIYRWIERGDFQNTQVSRLPDGILHTSVNDISLVLIILNAGLHLPEVASVLSNPDLGDGQAMSVGEGYSIYGMRNQGEDHRSFILIARPEQGMTIGLVLLNRELCCDGKADLALMLLWNAAAAF